MSDNSHRGIEISNDGEVLMIDGIRYARSLFRDMANDPIGAKFEIIDRGDGTVVLRRIEQK
jgi:hypothetical protein